MNRVVRFNDIRLLIKNALKGANSSPAPEEAPAALPPADEPKI
jgi:hypothetical protein